MLSKIKEKLLISIIVVGLICIFTPLKINAALQSNGGTPATKDVNGWITQIRQMQASGGALGLTDTIGADLTSTNTNLDIHMEKNTEYGAMVLLSASSYGNPEKIENGGTTTGNATGVYMNINKEWVAAGMANTAAASMKNAAGRYKNQYTAPTYTEKVGDAVAGVAGWHGSGSSTWISVACNQNIEAGLVRSGLIRAYSGSIFSYNGYGYSAGNGLSDLDSYRQAADYRKAYTSRAVVVVGSGV